MRKVKDKYQIAVSTKDTIPSLCKPFLPFPSTFQPSDLLRRFLLQKAINLERAAVMNCPVFVEKNKRTRRTLIDQCLSAAKMGWQKETSADSVIQPSALQEAAKKLRTVVVSPRSAKVAKEKPAEKRTSRSLRAQTTNHVDAKKSTKKPGKKDSKK